jgi:hypothetical protein
LALHTLHEARPVCPKKYSASQHEAFAREDHNRVNWHGTLARKPFVTQLFLQHVSLRSSMLNFRSPTGVPTSLDANFVYAVGGPARAGNVLQAIGNICRALLKMVKNCTQFRAWCNTQSSKRIQQPQPATNKSENS